MKKIISVLVAMTILFTAITSYAAAPTFLTENYNNYTADYTMAISFDNGAEVAAFIEENVPDEPFLSFFDLRSLLSSLLRCSSTMFLQANISDDYSKAQMALTSDSLYDVDVSKNMNVKVSAKAGLWLNMDLNLQNPVMEIIALNPMSNKYLKMNVLELLPEEQKTQIIAFIKLFLNEDFINSINEASIQLMEKYATIITSGNICTVKIDNDAFISIAKEMNAIMTEKMEPLIYLMTASTDADVSAVLIDGEAASIGIIGGADGPTAILTTEPETEPELSAMPLLDGVQFLGEDGLTYKYTLVGGKISKAEYAMDISFNLSELIGEMWPSEKPLNLDFTFKGDMKLSKVGKTTVQFPELTAENSIDIKNLIPENTEPEYEATYPNYYVDRYISDILDINDEYYIPLREIMEAAYEDQVSLEYNDGEITLESEWFPGFRTLKLREDSIVAYTDDKEIRVSPVIVKDGTTFVSCDLFTDVFKWELSGLTHIISEDSYYITLYTKPYSYYEDNYEETYPYAYAYTSPEELPAIDGEIYIPLRQMMEAAYDTQVSIGYDNGEITLKSDWFPDFKTLKLYENSAEAYADESKITVSPVLVKNGTSYVSCKDLESIFGWELINVSHNLIEDTYFVEFYTLTSEY